MEVTRDELLHIVKLADLNIKEDEVDNYLKNLEDILNFAKCVNEAPVDDLDVSIGANMNVNVFRKDEVLEFADQEALLENAPDKENNMFKIPKVLQLFKQYILFDLIKPWERKDSMYGYYEFYCSRVDREA